MRHPRLAAALLAGTLALAAPAAHAQCAMCRASVERSVEGQGMASELNQAILVMFLAPYLVLGTCAVLLFRRRLTAFALRLARRSAPRPALLPEGSPTS